MEKTQLKSFKNLIIWQKAVGLATLVYKITENFPRSELYGITNQMRRAAISISSNIAEGFKRSHKKEKLQFYNVAYGSVAELESQIEIAYKLKFLKEEEYKQLNLLTIEISKMNDGLIKSVNKFPKLYILNSIFLIFSLYSVFYILNPIPVIAAEIFFEAEKGEIALGQDFQVNLKIDAQNESINAIEGKIVFPEDLLQLKEIRDGDSIINFWVERAFFRNDSCANNLCQLFFSGIIPGGFEGITGPDSQGRKPGKILGLIFRTKKVGEGAINIESVKALLNDGLGTSAKVSLLPLQFKISSETPYMPEPSSIEDNQPPEEFQPIIAQDPNIFEGKYFLVFASQDKGSGIDHYEVYENSGFRIQNLGKMIKKILCPKSYILNSWDAAESPYLLNDQNLRSYVYVKTADKAGNERITVLPPRYPLLWYENYWIWAMIIVGIIVGIIIAYFGSRILWRKYKK